MRAGIDESNICFLVLFCKHARFCASCIFASESEQIFRTLLRKPNVRSPDAWITKGVKHFLEMLRRSSIACRFRLQYWLSTCETFAEDGTRNCRSPARNNVLPTASNSSRQCLQLTATLGQTSTTTRRKIPFIYGTWTMTTRDSWPLKFLFIILCQSKEMLIKIELVTFSGEDQVYVKCISDSSWAAVQLIIPVMIISCSQEVFHGIHEPGYTKPQSWAIWFLRSCFGIEVRKKWPHE